MVLFGFPYNTYMVVAQPPIWIRELSCGTNFVVLHGHGGAVMKVQETTYIAATYIAETTGIAD